MLDHVSIPVRDLATAVPFYDAVLAALGQHRVHVSETAAGYGLRNSADDDGHCYLSIVHDPRAEPPDCHWAFRAGSPAAVHDFARAATDHGGTAISEPRIRTEYHPHYYAAFVTDPSGNRLEAVHHRRITSCPLP
jgi:catechol 2,3-dioxygenase-like lactoylglutathione lyase family enzyme